MSGSYSVPNAINSVLPEQSPWDRLAAASCYSQRIAVKAIVNEVQEDSDADRSERSGMERAKRIICSKASGTLDAVQVFWGAKGTGYTIRSIPVVTWVGLEPYTAGNSDSDAGGYGDSDGGYD